MIYLFLVCTIELNIELVYLLMPIDCAMLHYAKSTISHRTPTEITRQQVLWTICKAYCYTDRYLSVIGTYIHGKVQTPLVDLLSIYMYYTSKFAMNECTINRVDGAWDIQCRSCVISMFTYYEDMKGDEKCINWGSLEVRGPPRSSAT